MCNTVTKFRLCLKHVELILACICMVLSTYFEKDTLSQRIFLPVVYGGFIFIQFSLVCSFMLFDRAPKRIISTITDLLYSFLGTILFFVAGGVTLEIGMSTSEQFNDEDSKEYACTAGGVALTNGVVYLIDLGFAYKDDALKIREGEDDDD